MALPFGERRRHPRIPVDIPVRFNSPRGEVPARAVNVSAGGVLLALADADLADTPPIAERSLAFAVAQKSFGAHLEVWFLGKGVTSRSRLVRVVCPPDEGRVVYLGMQFREALTAMQFDRLGLKPEAAALPEALPTPNRGTTGLTLHVGGTHPPREMRLLDAGQHLLSGFVPAGDGCELAGALGGRRLAVQVLEAGGVVHSDRACLLSVSVTAPPVPGVAVELLCDSDPRVVLGARLARPPQRA